MKTSIIHSSAQHVGYASKKGKKEEKKQRRRNPSRRCATRTRMLLHTKAESAPFTRTSRLVVRNQIKVDGVPSLPDSLEHWKQDDSSGGSFLSNISSLCMLESNEKHHLFEAVMPELNFSSHSQ